MKSIIATLASLFILYCFAVIAQGIYTASHPRPPYHEYSPSSGEVDKDLDDALKAKSHE